MTPEQLAQHAAMFPNLVGANYPYRNVSDLVWANAEHTAINCLVDFDNIDGNDLTKYTATPTDITLHSVEIFNRAVNLEFGPIAPYVPPTPEQLRERMPSLTHRELWLAGLEIGIRESDALALINSIPDDYQREAAMIEFTKSSTVKRTHPLVVALLAGVGLEDYEADALWMRAVTG
jgi:hypothetical protein